MPRVVMNETDRNRYKDAEDDKAIRARAKAWCGLTGKQLADLAQLIGVSQNTMYRRMRAPEEMPLKEYRIFMRVTAKAAEAASMHNA